MPRIYIKAHTDATVRLDAGYDLDDRPGLRVLSFAAGTGDTITITINGIATVLTEGVDFDAVVSNAATAVNIAGAIDAAAALSSVSPVVEGDKVRLLPDSTVRTLTIATSDTAAFLLAGATIFGTLISMIPGETQAVDLPIGTLDPLNKVSYLRVLSGSVSADLRSPIEMRTHFKQPGVAFGSATLRATTGHPGGWTNSPNPPTP